MSGLEGLPIMGWRVSLLLLGYSIDAIGFVFVKKMGKKKREGLWRF